MCLVFATVAAAMALPARADSFRVPPLTGAVVDTAAMMDPATRQELDTALRRIWQEGGSQIAVLTVADLGGLPIEQASIQVTDAWKLGTKRGDNGVLLLVSQQEHGLRIEVGQGLEGALTDAHANRIINDVMIPEFRAGNPTGGIVAGVAAILHDTDPDRQLSMSTGQASRRAAGGTGQTSLPGWVFLLILVIIIVAHRTSRGSRYGASAGFFGGWGGGGGSGGGFSGGGGGFSGGGGGFSGGGASGRW